MDTGEGSTVTALWVIYFLIAGPPFGGLFYSVGGKGLPFFILAGFIFITFGLYYFNSIIYHEIMPIA